MCGRLRDQIRNSAADHFYSHSASEGSPARAKNRRQDGNGNEFSVDTLSTRAVE